jgi:hypothetical protein
VIAEEGTEDGHVNSTVYICEVEMFMLVQDSNDGKEPYIVPHIFKPIENNV